MKKMYRSFVHEVKLGIVLPTTTADILGLLYAMESALRADAERYKKDHKTGDENPAVADKIFAADRIEETRKTISEANKERWAK